MIIYTRKGCAPCNTLKYFLNKNGIAFIEKDPPQDIRIVPTIHYKGHVIEGLNWAYLKSLL